MPKVIVVTETFRHQTRLPSHVYDSKMIISAFRSCAKNYLFICFPLLSGIIKDVVDPPCLNKHSAKDKGESQAGNPDTCLLKWMAETSVHIEHQIATCTNSYVQHISQKNNVLKIMIAPYHAEAAGNSRICNASIHSEQYDINVKQDGSNNDHRIEIGTGKFHNSVRERRGWGKEWLT